MSSMRPIQPKEVHGIKGFFIHLFIYLLAATSIIPQCMVVYTSFRATKMQVFCGWIFPGKLPQGVLHSHPVHQEYISFTAWQLL